MYWPSRDLREYAWDYRKNKLATTYVGQSPTTFGWNIFYILLSYTTFWPLTKNPEHNYKHNSLRAEKQPAQSSDYQKNAIIKHLLWEMYRPSRDLREYTWDNKKRP